MKRYIAGVIISMLCMLMLAGCSRIHQTDKAGRKPITFVFYNADGKEDPWTDPVAEAITKATGVTLETDYPINGSDERIALMIATGEYPDLIFAKGDAGALIDNGSLLDLSDLIDQYGPHIKQFYGEEYEKLRYSQEDKSIYQLSCTKIQNKVLETSGSAQLQWAVILANDYKIPRTLDQYEKMIKKYISHNPSIEGKKTIGISICCSDWHWYPTLSNPAGYIANGSPDNGQWIVDDKYKVHYKHAVKGQKEYYAWLNRMYAEGILDPEFATQTYADYLEKLASGRVLAIMDASWDYLEAEQALCAEGKYDRTYAGLPITMNKDMKCTALQEQGIATGWGIGITKSCKDPVRAVQFLDWLCTDEAQILVNWGIEGVNYYYDKAGKRYRSEAEVKRSEEDPNYAEETGVGKHNYPFPCYGSQKVDEKGNSFSVTTEESIIKEYNIAEKKALENWNVHMLTDIFPQADTLPKIEYSPLWAQVFPVEATRIEKKLDEIAWKGLIQCVVCKPELFDANWNWLQKSLKEAGREKVEAQLTEIVQAQVKLWQKQKEETG
ncbi:extracellular solute-binding protein [[Clostridium] polysaccharolyticum]|uniref:Carbohydrate ABC transporter substrate-binding protein, CUT1 family (TC 3.A.1.1.-) n=1 Tax=[Clostridium] polysaccharolyticum TaxID=29364 RepID=A0A1I0EMK2_9FIRM|nr:extracellular solute-binding protein [[Clostridium] polysaccharolyticum]SET46703.1 carbohydrate ABC transporter substrate-binding protein, CUT1 family (TC 3.A.1.1.-) [[Clostridium] polysaccharolyticum]